MFPKRLFFVPLGLLGLGVALGWLSIRWEWGAFEPQPLASRVPSIQADDEPYPPLPAEGEPAAVAVVAQPEFIAPRMMAGAAASHPFEIRNDGKAPLTLVAGLLKSCSCARLELPAGPIPPGGTGEIWLHWSTRPPRESFREYATVLTNDPRQRRIKLTVVGDLELPLVVEPSELLVPGAVEGQETRAEIALLSFGNAGFKVLSAEVEPPAGEPIALEVAPLPAQVVALRSAKSGTQVTVLLKPGLPLGPIRRTIRLATNQPERPTIEIPLHGEVVPPVTLVGRGWNAADGTLRLGVARPGSARPGTAATSTRDLFLRVQGDGHAETKVALASAPPGLDVSIGMLEHNAAQRLSRLTLKVALAVNGPADPPGGSWGEIVLTTTHPRRPEVRLRVIKDEE